MLRNWLCLLVSLLLLVLSGPICLAQSSMALSLSTDQGEIKGTLLLAGETPAPIVLMVAGSGPTDRDGNQPRMQNNSLRLLAEALCAQGIASLRYDKRGVGESAKVREQDLRFDHYAQDVSAWVALLKQDQRFSEVWVLGHSEGSLLALVALQTVQADGFISLAGAGRRATEILSEQLRPKLPGDLARQAEQIMQRLLDGESVEAVPDALQILFRPSVQPYLKSWFRHDPVELMRQLDLPSLVVQGSSDLQVNLEDAERLAAGQRQKNLLVIQGMNHVLKQQSGDLAAQLASYTDPGMRLHVELADGLVEFIRAPGGAE